MDNNGNSKFSKKTMIIIVVAAVIVIAAIITIIAMPKNSEGNNPQAVTATEIATNDKGETIIIESTSPANVSSEASSNKSSSSSQISSSVTDNNSSNSNDSSSSPSNSAVSSNTGVNSSNNSDTGSSSSNTGASSTTNTTVANTPSTNAVINGSNYNVGDTVRISYYLTCSTKFTAIDAVINYDSSVLTIDSNSVKMPNLQGGMANPNTENQLTFLAAAATAANDFSSEKLLISCDFTIASQTTSSDVKLNINELLDNDLLNIADSNYTVTAKVEKV